MNYGKSFSFSATTSSNRGLLFLFPTCFRTHLNKYYSVSFTYIHISTQHHMLKKCSSLSRRSYTCYQVREQKSVNKIWYTGTVQTELFILIFSFSLRSRANYFHMIFKNVNIIWCSLHSIVVIYNYLAAICYFAH